MTNEPNMKAASGVPFDGRLIPDDLRELDQWVLWRYEERNGKPTKVPYSIMGALASSTDPTTWASYEDTLATYQKSERKRFKYSGIGWVFSHDDPYFGIDLDNCLDYSEDCSERFIKPWAQPIIGRFSDTYMEVSPSEYGVKIWGKGKLPGSGKRISYEDGAVEMYDWGRFFVVTGKVLEDGAPMQIEEHQTDVERLYNELFGAAVNGTGRKYDLKDFPKIGAKAGEGDPSRHEFLKTQAARLRNLGMKFPELLATLKTINAERCDPPKPEKEVEDLARYFAGMDSRAERKPAAGAETSGAAPAPMWEPDPAPPEGRGPTKAGGRPVPLKAIDARTIFRSDYPEPEFVIDGLLTKGVTFCCGRPKIGKSWLVLQLALAVARGTRALGKFAIRTPGRVVYCGLEEPPRRTSSRLKKFITSDEPYLENVHMVYRLKPLLAGGAAELDEYLTRNPAELLIIDTYLAVLQASSGKDLLRSDYREVQILSELAQKHNVAVLVVHHLRKMPAEYSLDAVAGTTGLTASADSIWALTRTPDGTFKLSIQGRDMENRDFELTFSVHDGGFGWRITAEGAEIGMSNERKEILLVLEQEAPLTPANIARLLGNKNAVTVRRLLQKLVQDSLVVKGTDQKYRLSSLSSVNGVNERESV